MIAMPVHTNVSEAYRCAAVTVKSNHCSDNFCVSHLWIRVVYKQRFANNGSKRDTITAARHIYRHTLQFFSQWHVHKMFTVTVYSRFTTAVNKHIDSARQQEFNDDGPQEIHEDISKEVHEDQDSTTKRNQST